MYADDLRCFCPSLSGLNELLAVCSKYAVARNIVFNASKSFGMMFGVKYRKDFKPKLSLDGKIIKFVDSVKYLGVFLTDTLSDDCDITRQVKYLYAVGNSLRSKFQKCSIHIKNMLFRAHCCTLYASQLWCCYTCESYRRLRVSYSDSYRSIHGILRYCSVCQYQVEANVDTFDALVRKLLFRFMNRCHRSTTVFIHSLLHSCRFRCSKYVARFYDLLTVNGWEKLTALLWRSIELVMQDCKPFFLCV